MRMTQPDYKTQGRSTVSDIESVLRETAYYEKKAAEYDLSDMPLSRALATVYRYSAFEKRVTLSTMEEPCADGAIKSSH